MVRSRISAQVGCENQPGFWCFWANSLGVKSPSELCGRQGFLTGNGVGLGAKSSDSTELY